LDERTLLALDRNYRLASVETFAASQAGAAYETRDVLCVSCGYPIPEFSWAFLKLPGADPVRGAEEAERFFAARSSPFRFVVRRALAPACDEVLQQRGHARLEKTTPGMSIPLPLAFPPAPAGMRIEAVGSPQSLADFQTTAFAGFGMPTQLGSRFLTDRLLASPDVALRVGYVEDVPVSTAMMIATGRIAGIYWVATPEAHRRQGHAEAVTWAALGAGREAGCTIGCLQASEMGRPVYERMGFSVSAEYVQYQRTAVD
jgi:ribosomal protein S18 acetylase RimI-like enzyme